MGPSQEDAIDAGFGAFCLEEVIYRSDIDNVVDCGKYLGVVDASGEEAGGSSCEDSDTGEKVDGKKAE